LACKKVTRQDFAIIYMLDHHRTTVP